MKKLFTIFFALIFQTTVAVAPARAWFGTDAAMMIPYLIKLIAEAVRQYNALRTIYGEAKSQRQLIEAINAGINNALNLLETMPIKDENVLSQLQTFKAALGHIETLYGTIPKTPEEAMMKLHDDSVAESIKIANALKEYAALQERNAEVASQSAGSASPKGAARISVQTSSAILHTLSQLLRVNGQMLKLQSEQLALSNKESKEDAYDYKKTNEDMAASLSGFWGDYAVPKFGSE